MAASKAVTMAGEWVGVMGALKDEPTAVCLAVCLGKEKADSTVAQMDVTWVEEMVERWVAQRADRTVGMMAEMQVVEMVDAMG